MKVYLTAMPDGTIQVQARAEGEGARGDLFREVRPGGSFLGWPYADLAALGDGEHDLQPAGVPRGR